MRILFVIPTLEKGGAEYQLTQLAIRLQERGYETAVIALQAGGRLHKELSDAGVEVTVLKRPTGISFGYKNLLGLIEFIRVVRAYRPDTVVGFLYETSIVASLAARVACVPWYIAARRDCGFQRAERPAPRWIERLSYQFTARFVANSHAVAVSMQEQEQIPFEQIEVIFNGVATKENLGDGRALRQALSITDGDIVVVMLASFWPHKNHLMLVRAAQHIVSDYPHTRFVLAGTQWDYQSQVENEVQRLGLTPYFRFLGQVRGAADVLPMADIGVLTSESEGLSNTILEYMAWGIAVVATEVGGNSEAIKEGETGFLVELNNTTDLAAKLRSLISDKSLRQEMGQRGRERIFSEFSWDKSVSAWLELFSQLINIRGYSEKRL